MGEEHTTKDREIGLEDVRQLSTDVACHTSMWLKMLRVGEGHNQTYEVQDRLCRGGHDSPNVCSSKGP